MAITKTRENVQEKIEGRQVEIKTLEEEYYATIKSCPANVSGVTPKAALRAEIKAMAESYAEMRKSCPVTVISRNRAYFAEMERDYYANFESCPVATSAMLRGSAKMAELEKEFNQMRMVCPASAMESMATASRMEAEYRETLANCPMNNR